MLIGLVGKPSAGKSTFFKAATLAEVDIANYPFTTIKPNQGVAYVKVKCVEEEFNTKCMPRTGYCINGWRFIPIQLMDVAGLVPDAHQGKGRGNQFLDDLRQADVLIHVVDASGSLNAHGEPISTGSHNPADDIIFLEHELDMWYYGILHKGWDKFARQIQQEKQELHKALAKQLSGLQVTEEMIETTIGKLGLDKEHPQQWTETDLKRLATQLRQKTKPIVIAANKIDKTNKLEIMKQTFPDHTIVASSGEIELALREAHKHHLISYIPGEDTFTIIGDLTEAQQKGITLIKTTIEQQGNSGVQQTLDHAVFDVLNYMAIFPGGVNKLGDSEGRILPDCWLLPKGSTALDFAATIHTDLAKKFIRAIDVRTKKTVGKEHLLNHRDVIEIVTAK